MRPQSTVLPPDQAVEQARESRDRRTRAMEMTRAFATALSEMKLRHAQELAELTRNHHRRVEALFHGTDAAGTP